MSVGSFGAWPSVVHRSVQPHPAIPDRTAPCLAPRDRNTSAAPARWSLSPARPGSPRAWGRLCPARRGVPHRDRDRVLLPGSIRSAPAFRSGVKRKLPSRSRPSVKRVPGGPGRSGGAARRPRAATQRLRILAHAAAEHCSGRGDRIQGPRGGGRQQCRRGIAGAAEAVAARGEAASQTRNRVSERDKKLGKRTRRAGPPPSRTRPLHFRRHIA